jgi:hypothetical protein
MNYIKKHKTALPSSGNNILFIKLHSKDNKLNKLTNKLEAIENSNILDLENIRKSNLSIYKRLKMFRNKKTVEQECQYTTLDNTSNKMLFKIIEIPDEDINESLEFKSNIEEIKINYQELLYMNILQRGYMRIY